MFLNVDGKEVIFMSNVITITELTNRYKNYVTELRRSFHQWPELGFEEQKTTQHIADELDKIGVPYKINPEKNTGIVAWRMAAASRISSWS